MKYASKVIFASSQVARTWSIQIETGILGFELVENDTFIYQMLHDNHIQIAEGETNIKL